MENSIKYFTTPELLRIVGKSNFPNDVKVKLYERIKRRTFNHIMRTTSLYHHKLLNQIFIWGASEEGHEYWSNYAKKFYNVPIAVKYKILKEL